MSWIRTVPPEEAEGDLKEIYRLIASARGGIADIHQVQSLNPRALGAHLELYKAVVFQRSTLDRTQRERIAVVVSAANGCRYCVAHHGEVLRRLGEPAPVLEALGRGEIPDSLGPADLALLSWAREGATDPAACSEPSVLKLRALGFDDRAILDAALTVAYFSFVNRLALLLGVSLEGDYTKTCRNVSEDPL